MKIVGIMQPYFMPYIGYWQHINAVDKFVLYDDVNFIKKGWINRNRIIVNGKMYTFTLPLQKVSQNKKINEHLFVNEYEKEKLWNIIYSSYLKAPNWKNVEELLYEIICFKTDNLSDYIYYSIKRICRYLDIKTDIIISSSINKNNKLKGQEKILDICKILGADIYINPSGGIELYDNMLFSENNIELLFIYPQLCEYRQNCDGFIRGLSIIDLMCNMCVTDIKHQLEKYELRKKVE